MIAVLGWCDGFGNDTYVAGIFQKLEDVPAEYRKKAPPYTCQGYHWVEFSFGEVEFDWWDGKEFSDSGGS